MNKQSIREILEYFGREDLLPPIPVKLRQRRRIKRRPKEVGKWSKACVECEQLGIVYYRNPPQGTPERTGWNPRLYRRGWWLPENEDGEPEYLGLNAIEALRKYRQR